MPVFAKMDILMNLSLVEKKVGDHPPLYYTVVDTSIYTHTCTDDGTALIILLPQLFRLHRAGLNWSFGTTEHKLYALQMKKKKKGC